jgi:hypothetical protein
MNIMDEVELLKSVGEVWDDAAEIVESMHELRKRIEALCAEAKGKDELAEIYKLVHSQVDLVLASLRITLDRVQSGVHASASTASTGLSRKGDGAGDGAEQDSPLDGTLANEHEQEEAAAPEA